MAQDLNPYAAVLQLYNYHNDLNLHVDVPVSAQQWMKFATFLLHVGTWQVLVSPISKKAKRQCFLLSEQEIMLRITRVSLVSTVSVSNVLGFSCSTQYSFPVPGTQTFTWSSERMEWLLCLQEWVFVLGGVGVFLGFALWGWKIVSCIGGGITYMSPARGYCAQFSAVAAALLATRTNLPVSTTHIVIASILGVGLADNVKVIPFCRFLVRC